MTEATMQTIVIAVCSALPPTIAAWAALRQAQRNHIQQVVAAEKQEEIHTAVNGNLDKVKAELAEANVQIVGLHKLVAEMMKHDPNTPSAATAAVAAADAVIEATGGVTVKAPSP